MSNLATLYGTSLSLYTGKVRSYLIKNGIGYKELLPTSQHFAKQVLPAAAKMTIPIVETADGEVIRDGTLIIDHYEAANHYANSPLSPKQRIISRLFDVIGSEGLLRPAMHYRWNFPAENLAFNTKQFRELIRPNLDVAALAEKNMNNMRMAAKVFGVSEQAQPVIEAVYIEFLDLLDQHFEAQPYLLGRKPSVGDYGLMAPMYAHLGRDPKPLSMMQKQAFSVCRWVERMNRLDSDMSIFGDGDNEYLANDEIPPTLIALLKHIAEDFVPETVAAAACINHWIDSNEALPVGGILQRGVGMADFELRGETISALAQPYRFFLLQRVHDEYASLADSDKQAVDELFAQTNLSPILSASLKRRITFKDNAEVWE